MKKIVLLFVLLSTSAMALPSYHCATENYKSQFTLRMKAGNKIEFYQEVGGKYAWTGTMSAERTNVYSGGFAAKAIVKGTPIPKTLRHLSLFIPSKLLNGAMSAEIGANFDFKGPKTYSCHMLMK